MLEDCAAEIAQRLNRIVNAIEQVDSFSWAMDEIKVSVALKIMRVAAAGW